MANIFDEFLGKTESSATPAPAKNIFDEFLGQPTHTVERKDDVTVVKPIRNVDELEASRPKAEPLNRTFNDRTMNIVYEGVRDAPKNYIKGVVDNALAGRSMVGEGLSDIAHGASATGVGKIGLGALSAVASPLTAATQEFVEKPITAITGSPEIGSKAGFVAGFALPVAPSASAVKARMPKNRAFQTIVDTVQPENLPAVINELKSNPRLTLMDVSPGVKQMAQQLVVTEGKHLNHLSNVVEQRFASAPGAVRQAIDDAVGPEFNVADKVQSHIDAARAVGNEKINPVVKAAKPVDVTPVIEAIDARLKPGISSIFSSGGDVPNTAINRELKKLRDDLTNDKKQLTDAQVAHDLQWHLRKTAENNLKATDGPSKQLGRAQMKVRDDLVTAIDKASPQVDGKGTYKPALGAYRDEKEITEAFRDVGFKLLSNSKAMENDPSFFAKWKKQASDAEIEAAKDGVRTAFRMIMGTNRNAARAGEGVIKPDFNKEKLRELLGETEANKMIKALEDESKIAQVDADLFRNSQTAMRSAANSRIALPTKSDAVGSLVPPAILEGANFMAGGAPILPTAIYGGIRGASAAKDKIATKLAQERNFQISKLATATGEAREQLIRQLEAIAYPAPRSIARRASSALSKVIGP